MSMYALATIPLIIKLNCNTKQICYADDVAATGKMANLCVWWDQLTKEGPNFGYFPNPSKTWLVTKKGCHDAETPAFADMGVNITSEGRPYLGAAIGSEGFVENYVKSKVSSWHSILLKLATIATTQLQAAYSALTHGVLSKWIYLSFKYWSPLEAT